MPKSEAIIRRNALRNSRIREQHRPDIVPPGSRTAAFDAKTDRTKNGRIQGTGIKVDFEQSHHIVPVGAYAEYTDGMTAEQIRQVDAALQGVGLYKGSNMLNRTDLPGRFHQGRSEGAFAGQGIHQRAIAEGVDGPGFTERWANLTPDERVLQLPQFVEQMQRNQRLAQESGFNQNLIGPEWSDPQFAGNLAQQVLNPRNQENADRNAANAKKQREHLRNNTRNVPIVKPEHLSGNQFQMFKLGGGQAALADGKSLSEVIALGRKWSNTPAPTPPTTSAPQGQGPQLSNNTGQPNVQQVRPQQTSGGYQVRNQGGWETPPVTTSTPPPQNTNWGTQVMTVLGGGAALAGEMLRGLFLQPRGF